mgnify:FL=1
MRRLAVVGAFLFGQFLVGDQAGVFLAGVVAFGSETPALGDAGRRPYLVDVARERFGEGCQRGGQFDAADVDRLRNIRLFHVRLFSVAFLRALLPVGAAAVGKADLRSGGNACCPNKNSDFFEPHDLFLPKVGTLVGILNGKGEIHPLTITNILGVMLIYDFTRLEPGGLYLFFPAAAPSGGLWGIFERHDRRGGVLLAVCSSDLRGFELWSPLPSGYTSCRPASQEELGLFTRGLNLRFSCD